jgi:membrane protease subunit HflK
MHHDHDEPAIEDQYIEDKASGALQDALRASFRVLKGILLLVLVLYALSGTMILDQNQQAVVSNFGKLEQDALGPGGFHFTLPRPFSEHIRVPVDEKRTLELTRQFLKLKDNESVGSARRGGGLDPKLDGSLMTGDRGLIHARWVVTYRISDLPMFYTQIQPSQVKQHDVPMSQRVRPEADIIRVVVENAGVKTVASMSAIGVSRDEIESLVGRVQTTAQKTLDQLKSGITIDTITSETLPPLQTKEAFEKVTKMSNLKQAKLADARKRRTEYLNGMAGASGDVLEQHFDAYILARNQGRKDDSITIMNDIERIIMDEATGLAGELVREAQSYEKQVLEQIRADAQEFRSYLVEYRRNKSLLFERLWNSAQAEIFTAKGVTKRLLPRGTKQVRLHLSPDPEEARETEEESYKKQDRQDGDFSSDEVRRHETVKKAKKI